MMKDHDIDGYINDLLNPNKGYAVVKHFLTPEQVDRYREECERFLQKGKIIHYRMNRKDIYDYIHPRTILPDGRITKSIGPHRQANTFRIYQFLHNKHSRETAELFSRALSLRDGIEENWLHDDVYRQKRDRLYDYVQVTKFVEDSLGLPKHQDSEENLPYPLLQCLILLSQPGEDYQGGDLIIYSKDGTPVKIQADLKMGKGDLVYFDKSLFHEVEPTKQSESSKVGRWSVVIGGRDRIRGKYFDRIRYRTFYLERIEPTKKRLNRVLRRFLWKAS